MIGWKLRSTLRVAAISALSFQKPTASPARKAAPIAGNRDHRTAECVRGRVPVNTAGRLDLRQHARRNIQFVENPLVPRQFPDVEQHRS